MKKLLSLITLIILLSMSSVYAKESKLYLIEKNNKLYYDNSLLEGNTFIKNLDMLPGNSYSDELIIENGSKKSYILYFKIEEKGNSKEANELLDSISMKLYLDNKLIYDGKIKGLDYKNSGINLQDIIQLKEFNPGDSAILRVETTLDYEYSNKDNNDTSNIDWVFYYQFEDNEPIKIVSAPSTGINKDNLQVIIISAGLCLIGILIIIIAKRNKE